MNSRMTMFSMCHNGQVDMSDGSCMMDRDGQFDKSAGLCVTCSS